MHSLALFSESSAKLNIPGRLSRPAQVPVKEADGFSKYLCRSCKTRFLSLEGKLQELRAQLQSSCSPVQVAPHSRKRIKDTGGQEVSPHTKETRPKSKRPVASRVLFPGQENLLVQECK